ncbi:MAG: peptidyl-tRNA hydrolase, family [Bacteroidales bacterium]|jgi:PTH1 family peptidyl-tRNA hydrolase|nr:peptidyl-tRNA hydrolase, family [Bacteroidales bacterium]MDN5328431.1 peptidyl-tRNA hydrolase, family [Bacteroidales bacterium]
MNYLIAGLGNPGPEYANTRHNAGFLVADALAQKAKATFLTERYADVAKLRYRGKNLIVIKPNTYMNLSGKAVRYWMEKENIPLENLMVVYDDLDLPLGTIRLRPKGSGGTHNGLNHIIEILQTENFPRMRIGIGSNFPKGMQVDYVLGRWTREEEQVMLKVIPEAAEAVLMWINIGIQRTMNHINKKQDKPNDLDTLPSNSSPEK